MYPAFFSGDGVPLLVSSSMASFGSLGRGCGDGWGMDGGRTDECPSVIRVSVSDSEETKGEPRMLWLEPDFFLLPGFPPAKVSCHHSEVHPCLKLSSHCPPPASPDSTDLSISHRPKCQGRARALSSDFHGERICVRGGLFCRQLSLWFAFAQPLGTF